MVMAVILLLMQAKKEPEEINSGAWNGLNCDSCDDGDGDMMVFSGISFEVYAKRIQ